jgi:tRNA nucleotidyltransferase/poly(A) polymerase
MAWYRKLIASNNEGVYQTELPNLKLPSSLMNILKDFDKKGRKGLVMGGAVRDALLGLNPKDIDVEVYGVNTEELIEELSKYGYANLVGAKFGVVKFSEPINFNSPEVAETFQKVLRGTPYQGMDLKNPSLQKTIRDLIKKAKSLKQGSKEYQIALQDPVMLAFLNNMGDINDVTPEYDFTIPRRDNKVGKKHTDYEVELVPDMSHKEAAGRRDLTINCFAGETKILTKEGVFEIKPLTGQTHELLTTNREWVKAEIKCGGKQPLMKITLKRNGVKKYIYATPNHRWFIRNNHTGEYNYIRTTDKLKRNNRLSSIFPKTDNINRENEAICRGFVWGDGSLQINTRTTTALGGAATSVANFCGEKDLALSPYFDKIKYGSKLSTYEKVKRICTLPPEWKIELPSLGETNEYLYSWLSGYFAADGCVANDGHCTLCSHNRESLEFVMKLCHKIGIGLYGEIFQKYSLTSYNPETPCYGLSFVAHTLTSDFFLIKNHKERFENRKTRGKYGWTVEKVEPTDRVEDVYCAYVPKTHAFALADNILTSNSIGYDPLRGQLHDYYNGVEDLNDGVLKATTGAFQEDLLRVWRILQFSTRLKTPDGRSFTVDPATAEMSRKMVEEYIKDGKQNLPKERIVEEFNKAMLKGKDFSSFFKTMRELGLDTVTPEFNKFLETPQDAIYHPEGNLATHTQYGLEHMKEIITRENKLRKEKGLPPMSEDDQLVRMYGILLHDVAKPLVTKTEMKNGRETITSKGHEPMGGPIAAKVLQEMGVKASIINKVVPIIEQHLAHISYMGVKDKVAWLRKLGRKLGSANYEDLFHIFEADHSSRPPLAKGLHDAALQMRDDVQSHGYYNGLPKLPIKGEHVQPYFVGRPEGTQGKHIGTYVKEADDAWVSNHYTTQEEGLAWLKNRMRSQHALVSGKDLLPYYGGKGTPEMKTQINQAWEDQYQAVQSGLPFDKDAWIRSKFPS